MNVLKFPLRLLRTGLKRVGLDIRTVRGQDHWRAGIEVLWHKLDERIERVAISPVEYGGGTLYFLVRNWTDWIQGHHLNGRLYAAEELELIRSSYSGGTFLDIGANVGNHSIFAARVLKAPKVIACEPNPEAYRILRCNIALNDLNDVVHHYPYGISNRTGSASIHTPDPTINLGGTRLRLEGGGSVELRAGDELLAAEEEIGFIKIDVEGLEMQVLEGLSVTIAQFRPSMYVEVDDSNRTAFDSFCASAGYAVLSEARPYRGMANLLLAPRPQPGETDAQEARG